MWEAIKWYANNGFKTFSFGKTEPENKGLLQFKRGWNTKEELINYYKYDLRKGQFVSKKEGLKTSYSIFQNMPLSVLKLTGKIMYRHVG
jgi:lipid II:glycine glycyltransferase (peptidoglycan interpeptide bridge formation enzyme)